MFFEKATDEEMTGQVRRGRGPVWPLAYMQVGDAITIKQGEYGKSNPQIYAAVFGKQSGKKFRTKKVAPDTYRVWRVA